MRVIKLKFYHGYSMVEFIVLMIVISILASFAFLRWAGSGINLGAQAKQLAGDIRYTQSLSMTRRERFSLVRTSATTYEIRDASNVPITLAFGNTSVTLGTGISFGSFTNLPNNLIAFNGKGAPFINTTTPGTALTSTASIQLISDSQSRLVFIAPETGRVSQQ